MMAEGFLSLLKKYWMTLTLMNPYLIAMETLDWIEVPLGIIPDLIL